jgi:hypothetical protein
VLTQGEPHHTTDRVVNLKPARPERISLSQTVDNNSPKRASEAQITGEADDTPAVCDRELMADVPHHNWALVTIHADQPTISNNDGVRLGTERRTYGHLL